MAVTAAPYAGFLLGLGRAQFNLEGGTVTAALAGASYLPDMVAHVYLSDVTNLVSAAAPQQLTGVSLSYANGVVTAVCNPIVWQAATFTARWAIFYLNTGTASTSRLIGYINFDADKTYNGEDFTLTATNGFVQIPAAV